MVGDEIGDVKGRIVRRGVGDERGGSDGEGTGWMDGSKRGERV